MRRWPAATAEKIATLSAHNVSPKLADSTLQPAKISPRAVSTAAPTRKFEYGAKAFSRADIAAATRRVFRDFIGFPDSDWLGTKFFANQATKKFHCDARLRAFGYYYVRVAF